MRGEIDDVGWASHIVQCALLFQLIGHGEDIHRVLFHVELLDGREDLLMTRLIEGFRMEGL